MPDIFSNNLIQFGMAGIFIAALLFNSKYLSGMLEKTNQSHVADLKELHSQTLKALDQNTQALVRLEILIETKIK